MEYIIKKIKNEWHVADKNGKLGAFADHDSAIKYAYNHNAKYVTVYYSPFVKRGFTRKALENFNLV